MLRNIEGKVRVQMYDRHTKKCVYDSGANKNIITNLYKYVMEDFIKSGLTRPFSSGISSYYSRLTPQMFSSGILLLVDPQVESRETLYPRGKIFAYAGNEYSGTDYDRGTLNTAETGPISLGDTKGYQWVWEWTSERANGTFSAVGLCPKGIGNGQLLTPYLYQGSSGLSELPIADISKTGYYVLDHGSGYYKQYKFGYTKGIKRGVGYFETLGQANEEINFQLSGAWGFCTRPTLFKNKIWLIAYYNDINDPNITAGQYLLKITKDTTDIEQMWQLASNSSLVTENATFGMTDTHMHYVYRPSGNDWLIRSFNLSTGTFEEIEPPASIGYTGGVSWFSSPTFAAVMGSNSMSTNPTKPSNYCSLIYPDQTVRNVPDLYNTYACLIPFGEKPYGVGFAGGYVCRYFSMLLSLFSVKNLEAPQTKDSSKTMKITYTITW